MLKILVVEDDEVTNFITKANLTSFGFEHIHFALNGQEALDYLRENECPSMIFLDINMPVLDGWGFLDVKERLDFCLDVPIVVTSSSSRPQDKIKAKSYNNVLEYFEKPLDFNLVNSFLMTLEKKAQEL